MKFSASQVASLALLAASLMLHNSAAVSDTATGKTYQTQFDGTENPISEGGAWSHVGTSWTKITTANGMAQGSQAVPRANHYDDSYAVLSGFGPDHRASAVIHKGSSVDSSCAHEFEILLRWSDSATSAKGYEVNLNFDGSYQQIVRWNGPYGDFTVLGGNAYRALKEGDTFEAAIVGNVITTYVNGIQVSQVTDNTYTSGNPGMGFFRGDCGSNSDIGFTSYKATSGTSTAARPMPPSNVNAN